MDGYRGVAKEELTGFRTPTDTEAVAIEKYVVRHMNIEKRAKYVGVVVVGGMGALLLLSTILLGADSGKTAENIMLIIVSLICLWFAVIGCIGIKKNKLLMSNVRNQRFEVMDCKAYEARPEIGHTGEGLVRIVSATNQPCENNFFVDKHSAHLAKKDKETPFIMFKSVISVYGREVQYYILLSDKMLERAVERR